MEKEYTLQDIKAAAISMAAKAGEIQMEHFRSKSLQMETKSTVYDVVTQVDKACENMLVKAISKKFPDHSIIGEETGKHLHEESPWAWVIDPLDGTNNYSQGLPIFCVSIGVTYKGECVVGVVYAPYLDELYTAVKGEGAWFGKAGEVSDANYELCIMNYELKRKRLHVSPKESLKECVVASGFPYDKATHPINNIREVGIVIPQVRGFRRMGSAAYDLCCTAMGTIDAYLEFNLNLWDVCAGQLIVREAGGLVIPLCDNRKISIIAGPEKLVKELQGELRVKN
jgi:myo-inositol-1(or 4)-monophosphatase